ncbi:MAG: hypothetical protein ABJP45_03580 [Cyclobacteriaceae bacterium]
MKFKYHNTLWVFLSVTALILIFGSVEVSEERLSAELEKKAGSAEKKDGLVKTFASDGSLKTTITYVKGIKHGKSVLYYGDGQTVQLEMIYQNGERHGISKKYYESGELYAETSYERDLLHGDRKTYYKSGKQKAIVPYKYGDPGTGLVEFLLNGKQKVNPEISYYQEKNRLYVSTSNPCREQKFYVGKLIDDRFFSESEGDMIALEMDGNDSFIDMNVYTPSYLNYRNLICKCESSQGNPQILNQRINTSSLKKVN